jgi:hypothetical protein
MGGGNYHLGKKPDSICSASVCFLVFALPPEKKEQRARIKKNREIEWAGPPSSSYVRGLGKKYWSYIEWILSGYIVLSRAHCQKIDSKEDRDTQCSTRTYFD